MMYDKISIKLSVKALAFQTHWMFQLTEKFIHILDCEQNKVELWEPKEEQYDKVVDEKNK